MQKLRNGQVYAYRRMAGKIEKCLNEARERGWELHTFTDSTEDEYASAVFRWVGTGPQVLPFKDEG